MNVYIGTSGELKNAYIGEVYEYERDFTDGTNTISSLQNQGWNFNSKSPSISSSGLILGNDGRIKFSPFSLSNIKRTICECVFQFSTSESNWNIGYGELSGSTHNAAGFIIPSYYTSNKGYGVSLLGSLYREDVSLGTSTYHSIITIDLENGTLSNNLLGYGTKSTTLTSSQINDIKQASGIVSYSHTTYMKYLRITFEY